MYIYVIYLFFVYIYIIYIYIYHVDAICSVFVYEEFQNVRKGEDWKRGKLKRHLSHDALTACGSAAPPTGRGHNCSQQNVKKKS